MKRLALLLLLCALAAPAQDIFVRLRQAPLPEGQGTALASALQSREFSRVLTVLSEAKAANPHDQAELLCLQGGVHFLALNMSQSAAAFLAAEKIQHLNEADTFTLAMAQIKLQQGAAATARLESLAAKSPNNPVYLYWLGKLDYDQRRYDEAVAKLQRVIALDPQSARAYNSLGLAYDMQGKFEPARDALTKAAALNRAQPKPSAWPPHDLGYLLLRLDQIAAAESALRESLNYDPSFAEAHYHLARVLEKQGSSSDAIAEYRRAIELDPSAAEPCYSLATLYRRLQRNAEAEQMFAEYRKRKNDVLRLQ